MRRAGASGPPLSSTPTRQGTRRVPVALRQPLFFLLFPRRQGITRSISPRHGLPRTRLRTQPRVPDEGRFAKHPRQKSTKKKQQPRALAAIVFLLESASRFRARVSFSRLRRFRRPISCRRRRFIGRHRPVNAQ